MSWCLVQTMKNKPITYTINLSDYPKDFNFSLDNSITYSVSYTHSTDPFVEYMMRDAEFDMMEDQTSIAKSLLNDIGIKVK